MLGGLAALGVRVSTSGAAERQPIATGPVVVDQSNINDLTQYISEGLR